MHFGSAVPTVEVGALSGEDFLLDVREDDEWNAGHAADALHIPMSAFVERYGELTEAAPQDGRVNVVCRSGARSAQVTMYLRQQGIDAVNVEGGMRAWEIAGLLAGRREGAAGLRRLRRTPESSVALRPGPCREYGFCAGRPLSAAVR